MERGRCVSAAGVRRKNLRIVTRAQATRIVFDGTRAVGVEFEQPQTVYRSSTTGSGSVRRGSELTSAVVAFRESVTPPTLNGVESIHLSFA